MLLCDNIILFLLYNFNYITCVCVYVFKGKNTKLTD